MITIPLDLYQGKVISFDLTVPENKSSRDGIVVFWPVQSGFEIE
jgi:hypothetical protein